MYVCIHAFCVTSDYGRLTTIITMSRPALNHGLGVRRCHPRTTRCLLSPLSLSLSLLSPNQGLGAAISAARTTVLTTVLLYYCALTYAIISLHRQSMRHEPSRAQEAEPPAHKPIGGRIPTTGCALTYVLRSQIPVPIDRPRHRICELDMY
jgi:hypothetical protein